jgi:catechol 2,3-dioxygenase-like lactoylglutathione lyase family enzyme
MKILEYREPHIRVSEYDIWCKKEQMMLEITESRTVQALKAHLAINVKDVNRSVDFYRKLWGIEPSKVRRGYAKFDVQNPPLNFTLNEVAFNERGALSHLGIQVSSTEDVLAVRERWAEQGLLTREEMQTSCCYAMQDKAWVKDPDGNEWEVFVVLQDNLAETAPCECGDKVVEAITESEIGATPVTAISTSCCNAPTAIAR